jgi:hypothetical protein
MYMATWNGFMPPVIYYTYFSYHVPIGRFLVFHFQCKYKNNSTVESEKVEALPIPTMTGNPLFSNNA